MMFSYAEHSFFFQHWNEGVLTLALQLMKAY